jgi:hypothetical protein
MDATLYTLHASKALLKVRGHASTTHTPLHIITLIDVSGSMGEECRLENVKRSLHHMYPFLGQADMTSLITFASSAHLHIRAQPMTADGLHHCQQVLNSLHPEDMTNLASALALVNELIYATPRSHKIGMLILTDGEINQGLTNTDALKGMVRALRTTDPSLTVFTIGYGFAHNHGLLSSIAEEGNGSYSVVNNQEQVAGVFGDMLGGLMSCVAQNVEVVLPAAATANTLLKVISDAGNTRVQVGDLYAEAEQSIILNVAPNQLVQVRYYDLVESAWTEQVMLPLDADDTVQAEAKAVELRLKVANFLKAPKRTDAAALIAEVEALPQPPSWTSFILDQLAEIRDGRNTVPAIAAQQSMTLGLGRGLISVMTPVSADPTIPVIPPQLYACFSSPGQRQVSQTITASASQDPRDIMSTITDYDPA